jgi:hypothetical protein
VAYFFISEIEKRENSFDNPKKKNPPDQDTGPECGRYVFKKIYECFHGSTSITGVNGFIKMLK